jgi:hypothetical protein
MVCLLPHGFTVDLDFRDLLGSLVFPQGFGHRVVQIGDRSPGNIVMLNLVLLRGVGTVLVYECAGIASADRRAM